MPIAYKEWAVTVRALAEGEQLLTFCDGHASEPADFRFEHDRFFLYPTFDQQRCDLVRESHRPELHRALEEGVWPDGEPHLRDFDLPGGVCQPERVRVRAWAEVAEIWTVSEPRAVNELSPYYVWTPSYPQAHLAWRRRAPLHVVLLRTHRIPRPVTVRVKDDFGGLTPFLEIARDLPFEGTPVLSDHEFERARDEIAQICGAPVAAYA